MLHGRTDLKAKSYVLLSAILTVCALAFWIPYMILGPQRPGDEIPELVLTSLASSPTPTATASPRPTRTATSTSTATSLPPTSTATFTPSHTVTPSNTPTATSTSTLIPPTATHRRLEESASTSQPDPEPTNEPEPTAEPESTAEAKPTKKPKTLSIEINIWNSE